MKKVIAISVWGNDQRYLGGSLQNVSLAKIFYPDWICRFYLGQSTMRNKKFIAALGSDSIVEIVPMSEEGDWSGMTWRFHAASDPTVDVMISRDADSRLGIREAKAVEKWVESDKMFHIMRDHPAHAVPIMGGLWGAKKGCIPHIQEHLAKTKTGDYWQCDQEYLRDHVYPLVKQQAMVHDEFFAKIPFPSDSKVRNPLHFAGQSYDGNGYVLDKPHYGWHHYKDYLKQELKIDWE